MEKNTKIVVLYRIAEKKNKYDKAKPVYISNIQCLKNFIFSAPGVELHVFGDRLIESKEAVVDKVKNFHEISNHGNAQSFNEVFDYALDNFEGDTIIYFVEDDYLHRLGFTDLIREGLEKVDYVTMYDHPDKYNGEPKTLFHTESTHWQLVESTTMTFAATVRTLKDDKEIIKHYTSAVHPHDHFMFKAIQENKKLLASPIPGHSTHGVTDLLSPIIDWEYEAQ